MKIRMLTTSGLALVCSLSSGLAAQAQKQSPPQGGPAKAFTVPAHETYTLPNGRTSTVEILQAVPYARS